jgi:hypothetical protein
MLSFTIKKINNDSLDIKTMDNNKYTQIKNNIRDTLDLHDEYIGKVKIATMTFEGKFKTTFYPLNIYNYMQKNQNSIVSIIKIADKKYRRTQKCMLIMDNRELDDTKYMHNDMFLNQVTVNINVSNKKNPVSVKIFSNGSVHFTGCITIDNLLEAIYKLCVECRRCIYVLDTNNTIKKIQFAHTPDVLYLEQIFDIKTDMVNCIFTVPFKIDRTKLQALLWGHKYNATYDSNSHAAVNIKFYDTETKINNKGKNGKITMLVFEQGSIIIILGKQGFKKINEMYNFIYKYLLENYKLIVKNDNIAWDIINKYIEKTN